MSNSRHDHRDLLICRGFLYDLSIPSCTCALVIRTWFSALVRKIKYDEARGICCCLCLDFTAPLPPILRTPGLYYAAAAGQDDVATSPASFEVFVLFSP